MGDRVCATVSLAPFDEELLAGTREGGDLLDAITESGFDETSCSSSNGVWVWQVLDADANYWVASFDRTGADRVITGSGGIR